MGLGLFILTLGKERQARERAVGAEREQIRLREEAQGSAFRAEQEAKRAEHNAAEAILQRKQAEALADDNRRNLYAARIKLAAQAIAEGDVPRGHELFTVPSFTGPVRSVAFSPDDRTLAFAAYGGQVVLLRGTVAEKTPGRAGN